MSDDVDFFYDFGSPAAYLAWTQLPKICADRGVAINYRPVLLGGLFKATGNATPVSVEAKGAWMFDDLKRWAAHYGVPFEMNPHFIINTLGVMRGAVWALGEGVIEDYNKAVYEAVWVNGQDMADPQTIAGVLTAAGFDASAFAAAVQLPEVKQGLIDNTEEAAERGAFGAPTMFVAGEMHFGQDRLDFVRRALERGRA